MNGRNEWVSLSEPYLTPRGDGQADAWTNEAANRGHRGASRIAEVAEVSPPADVATSLRLQPDEKAVVRRRVILLDDHPVELADSYFPATLASGTRLAENRKIPGGATTLLSQLGYRAHRVREEVTSRMPTSEECEALALADNEPVLILVRLVVSDTDVPMEVSIMTAPADGRSFVYEMVID